MALPSPSDFHTGHFELASMVKAAAKEVRRLKGLPFATFCSDPCDGRTQGTTGMMTLSRTATTLRRYSDVKPDRCPPLKA